MLGINRWQVFKTLAAILCIAGFSWIALTYVVPAPPSKITIATSFTDDHYHDLGRRYQGILASSELEVELRVTDGAKENLRLLNNPNSGIQIAFMQGGLSKNRLSPDLYSLGRIDHQVVWLFYAAGDTLADLTQLKGKRVALGAEGSGDRALCEKILAVAGITFDNTVLLSLGPGEAIKALDDGVVDAIFRNFPPDSPALHTLLSGPQYRLMSFTEAEALTRIFPYLVRLVLPRGAIDLGRKVPTTDTILVATTNVVLVRKEIHPAVIDLLTQTMLEAHGAPGLFQKAGDFPTHADPEYPVAQGAIDFYKNGPSLLVRYLPFWIANYAKRAFAVLVASIAIVVPLFRYLPQLYRWSMRRRLLYWYSQLKALEASIDVNPTDKDLIEQQTEIERIEDAVSRIRIPLALTDQLYNLRAHIDIVRRRLNPRASVSIRGAAE